MTREIHITIPGEPVAKARARVGRFGAYTPKKTKDWEEFAAGIAKQAMEGRPPIECAVVMGLAAVFSIPKSWTKKKKTEALNGRVPHTTRPDIDNLIKAFCDSANKVVFNDDSQIIRISAIKHYGPEPMVSVVVRPIGEAK